MTRVHQGPCPDKGAAFAAGSSGLGPHEPPERVGGGLPRHSVGFRRGSSSLTIPHSRKMHLGGGPRYLMHLNCLCIFLPTQNL